MTKTCERCQGFGYLHRTDGAWARAEVCACRRDCSECEGERYVLEQRGAYEVAKPCRCQGVQRRVDLFNEAGVPAGYGGKQIPQFVNYGGNQGEIKGTLARYERGFEPDASSGLLMVGDPGTGKTHLLCGLVNYLCLERGIRCRFVDFFHLTTRIRASFDHPNDESQESILAPLVEVPVLAIDELGKGLGTTWEQHLIDQLISHRYNAGRIIVATTNYLPEAWLGGDGGRRGAGPGVQAGGRPSESLEERIGLRAFSRLAEMCDVLRVKGPDYRREQRRGHRF